MKSTPLLWSLLLLLAFAGTPSVAEEEDYLHSANFIMPGCRALLSGSNGGFAMGLCGGIVEGMIYEMSVW